MNRVIKVVRKKITTIFDRIMDSFAFMAGITLILVMLGVGAEVVSRYFFSKPILGVLEFSEIGLLYITYLGAAWLLKKEGHVKVEMVLSRLQPKTQVIANVTTSLVCAALSLIVTWYGTLITLSHYEQGIYRVSLLHTPTAPVLMIIPIGSLLLSLQFLRRTYGYLTNLRDFTR